MSLRLHCVRIGLQATLWATLSAPLWVGSLSAQEISARAFLNANTVGVGRTFVVNVEITGTQTLDSEPQLPDLGAFATYLGSGTSSSMQIVNNRTTVSLTIQYRYQALEEGTFEIPSFTVQAGGDTHTTDPLTLTISSAPPPDSQESERSQESPGIGPEDLFITAETSRTRVREGEPFVVEYRIFTRVNVNSYGFTRIPEPEGFWLEELPLPDQPQVEQVVRNGQQYTTAVIRRIALVATGPGERTIEPLGIEAQVRVRQQRMMDPFESIFDFDRSSLFGSVVPVAAASNAISLDVEALPPGRPTPFSGVVGDLNLTATLSPDSLDANEAVTLTISATGEGNLRSIPEPTLTLPPDFEAYPPEVSETIRRSGAGLGGEKSWEYVLIPRAPGTRSIPPVSFGYFNTDREEYETVSTGPLELVVSGEMPEGPTAMVRGGIASLREDIRFIHLGSSRLNPVHDSLFQGTGFWLVFLLPLAGILGSLGLRIHQNRLEGDPAFARRRRAGRIAHARLTEARRLASGQATRDFYAEVARALRGFVADKLNVAEAGMQMRDVQEGLRSQGVSDRVMEEVAACLEHCDLKRFAPEGDSAEEEARFLERVSKLMTELTRELGR